MAAVLLAGVWTTAEVKYFYGGNWTGPFYIAAGTFPAGEPFDQFVVRTNSGFDGQFYLLAAYDPWLEKGYAQRMDLPGLRYNRILIPALANVLALGGGPQIPMTFAFLQWLFAGLGVWALADFAARRRVPAVYGLLMFAVPAVWISLDRMVVDMALVALLVVAVNEADARRGATMTLALAAACLTRDTGLLAAGLLGAWHWWRGEKKFAVLCAAAALPAAGWWSYVAFHHDVRWQMWLPQNQPFAPFAWTMRDLERLFTGMGRARHPLGRLLDGVALGGLILALWLTWKNMREWRISPVPVLCGGFALLGIYLFALGNWTHPYDYGRVLSPMLTGLLLLGAEKRRWWYALPSALILARVALQFAPKAAILGFNLAAL